MRAFQGRASEELYNQALTQLHSWLKTLHSPTEPQEAIEGALWIDSSDTLRVKRENKFVALYENVYQSMGDLISQNRPLRPVPGQLWVNELGTLTYYNGIKFEPVKAGAIEEFNMEGYEPFLIIDTLHAGANQIIKKDNNIIEEEFIAGEGAQEFILQKGLYETMQNKIVVYINGRILPKEKYLEHSTSTVRLVNPLHQGERIMLQYIPKNKASNNDYIPLKFHPALEEEVFIIKDYTHTVTLSKECLMGSDYMMLYVNGRFVGGAYYSIEDDKRTIRINAELEPNEEVLVQYINQLAYDNIPDGEIGVAEETPYTQYIWPSSEYDRLFINGKLNLDYETLSKVSIQYPSQSVQGKTVSAVHVHPKNLCDIKKRIYAIDKETGSVQADELNTEFYAITSDASVNESDFEKINLAPYIPNATMANNPNTRSFLLYVYPKTQYCIRRSVASNVFKITEHAARPAAESAYINCFDVPQISNVNASHTFTTNEKTSYIVIHVSTEGGNWHYPVVTTDVKTSKSLLLVKTTSTDTDYVSSVGGIVLSNYIKDTYDYILGVTYIFGETAGRGHLTRVNFDITESSQIIIGNIKDPLLVFAQGHYLIERDNYRYDKSTGLLTLLFPERLDIGVLTFPKYETGVVLELSNQGHGMIFLSKEYVKPLVFIYGEHVQQLVDFVQDNNVIYIKDAKIDMNYAVVDCVDSYGDSMFVGEGEMLYDPAEKLYYAPAIMDAEKTNLIFFVNGLLINKRDWNHKNNRIYILNSSAANMRYTLLRDDKGRFLHSNIKQESTYATGVGADQAMLYIDGNVIGDIEAFGAHHLPDTGYQREIKGLMRYDSKLGYVIDSWHMYIGNDWEELTDDTKKAELTAYLSHYILENKTVHFTNINLIKNKRCTAWLYKYDETIEYPLMQYHREMRDDTVFETLPAQGYPIGQNALSVYIDGYRQYPEKMNFPNGVKELTEHSFEIGSSVPGSLLDYIIEMPERGEAKSCISEVLTSDNVYNQTLKTTIPLLPGFIDLFIDGIRQPKTSFEVIDRHGIALNYFSKDPRYKNVFLVEVRKDFFLKEATREILKDGQTTFNCSDDMKSILYTKDFIKIYVNGVYVADDYDLVREHGVISIPKIDELGFAKKGHIVSFVWR